MSTDFAFPSSTSSARPRPVAGALLKPAPLKPAATYLVALCRKLHPQRAPGSEQIRGLRPSGTTAGRGTICRGLSQTYYNN